MATLHEFNASLETTRAWINDLMEVLQTNDEARACRAFRATVQELRDHLTLEEAADLAAQMPLLLRGIYYEGWRPTGKPVKDRSKQAFLEKVGSHFLEVPHLGQIENMVEDVFSFLSRRISGGEIQDVVSSLPKEIRGMWPEESARPFRVVG